MSGISAAPLHWRDRDARRTLGTVVGPSGKSFVWSSNSPLMDATVARRINKHGALVRVQRRRERYHRQLGPFLRAPVYVTDATRSETSRQISVSD